MRKSMVVFVICSIFLGGGCVRDEVPPEIEEAMQDVASAYTRNFQVAGKKREALVARISSLDCPQVKLTCYRRCILRILCLDPKRIDLRYRGRYLSDVVQHVILSVDVLVLTGAGKEEAWEARFKLLSYVRKHMRHLRESVQSMPKGEEGGVIRDVGVHMAYLEAKTGYNAVASWYEECVIKMEKHDFLFDTKDLSECIRARLQKKFEEFLGRPMRTREQCHRDHWNRNAIEFPDVSTRRNVNHQPTVRNVKIGTQPEVDVEIPGDAK